MVFVSMKSNVSIFPLISYFFCVLLKNLCLPHDHKYFLPYFLLEVLQFQLQIQFIHMIDLKLVFMSDVRQRLRFILFSCIYPVIKASFIEKIFLVQLCHNLGDWLNSWAQWKKVHLALILRYVPQSNLYNYEVTLGLL